MQNIIPTPTLAELRNRARGVYHRIYQLKKGRKAGKVMVYYPNRNAEPWEKFQFADDLAGAAKIIDQLEEQQEMGEAMYEAKYC
jgi:hypothetical protein